jgi:hypothetical protein
VQCLLSFQDGWQTGALWLCPLFSIARHLRAPLLDGSQHGKIKMVSAIDERTM